MPSPNTDTETERGDPAALLAVYLDSGCSEAAFADLVERTGGLVYAGALRRTGDPHLAEEVTQNVFTILARKAESLRHHPCLTPWIFKTTRYESINAMRSEKRRLRKIEAFAASLPELAPGLPQSEPLRDALPALYESLDHLSDRERTIVFARFFEKKKFSEIARVAGKSEGACKKVVERSLAKLSRLLTARGITLSGTALASALTLEFASAAPAPVLTAVAPKALAAAPSLSTAAVITNTFKTMSDLKTAALASAAVLALAAIPIARNQIEASKLHSQIAILENRQSALGAKARFAQEQTREEALAGVAGTDTIRDILNSAGVAIDIPTLINSLSAAYTTKDILGFVRAFVPVINLEPDAKNRLLEEVYAYGKNPKGKQLAIQFLANFRAAENPGDSLVRMIDLGTDAFSYSRIVSEWAASDPEAAFAWFMEQRDSGRLDGKGVYDSPLSVVLGQLVGTIAQSDPERAITILAENRGAYESDQIAIQIAQTFAQKLQESGDETQFARLLAANEDSAFRVILVRAAAQAMTTKGAPDYGLAFVERHIVDPGNRTMTIVPIISNQSNVPIAERGEWILKNLPQNQVGDAIEKFAWRFASGGKYDEIEPWLANLKPGAARDRGLESLALHFSGDRSVAEARATAAKIGNDEIRIRVREKLDSIEKKGNQETKN